MTTAPVFDAPLPPGVSRLGEQDNPIRFAPEPAATGRMMVGDEEDLATLRVAYESGQLPLKDYITMKAMMRMSRRPQSAAQASQVAICSGLDFMSGELDGAFMVQGSGLKQMRELEAIGAGIAHHSESLYQQFEAECMRDMGVEPGMPWSLREWRRRQPFGKFTTLARCAEQDAIVYQLLAQGKVKHSRAQLAQNLRSKSQCAMDGGRWDHAWFLTGQVDPIGKRNFAAPESQIAAIAGYVSAFQKLRSNLGTNIAHNHEVESEPLPSQSDEAPAYVQRAKQKGKKAG
jgi:hypothetical protein